MVQSLEKLRKASWIDDNTRAVVLEFTVFNPTYNVFASVQLWFEFTNIGTIDSSYHDIAIYQVHSLVNIRDIYRLLFQAAYLIVMHIYSIKTALRVWKMRHSLRQYFATIWTLLDFPIIILTYACIPVIFWQHVVATNISVDIQKSNSFGRKFISISQLLTCEYAILSMICTVHFLLMMNILRLSIFFGKRNILFACNLFRARQYVPYIAFLLSVIFITTVLTSRSLFGSYCVGLENFAQVVMYVVRLFRLSGVSNKNECTHDFCSFVVLMLFSFAAIFVMFMWRLLVIMCGIAAQHTPMTPEEKAELQFVDLLKCRLLSRVGYWHMDDCRAHMKSLQPRLDISCGPTPAQCRRIRRSLLYRRLSPPMAPQSQNSTSVATQRAPSLHPGKPHDNIHHNYHVFTLLFLPPKHHTGASSRTFTQI